MPVKILNRLKHCKKLIISFLCLVTWDACAVYSADLASNDASDTMAPAPENTVDSVDNLSSTNSPAVTDDASLFLPYAYVDASLGYVNPDYAYLLSCGPPVSGNHLSGNFVVGGDLGYRFVPNLAVEMGGYWWPNTTVTDGPFSGNISNFALFVASKLMVPLGNRGDVFAKFGGGYQNIQVSGVPFESSFKGWNLMYAAGFEFQVTDLINLGFSYVHFNGTPQTNALCVQRIAGNPNLFLGNFGFVFRV